MGMIRQQVWKRMLGPALFLLGAALCYGLLLWSGQISAGPERQASAQEGNASADLSGEFTGRTQPAPGRSATIAPVVLHPVDAVPVKLGDRVKKDQVLVVIDADEQKAVVEAKKAALAEMKAGLVKFKAQPREQERAEARAGLEATRVSLKEARRFLERVEDLWVSGALSEKVYFDGMAARARFEAEERAAVARLEKLLKMPIAEEITELEAKIATAEANLKAELFELEHYTVQAPIAGVITRLEVNVGMVSRPGTTNWGDILDLSELDVRCELTSRQADQVRVGQKADVSLPGVPDRRWPGTITYIGQAANKDGRIPVLIRVANPQETLRANVEVKVRFQ
jgi:multidrug resistance efflux pump